MRVLVMGSTGTGMARFRKHLLADLALRADEVFAAAAYEREQDRQAVIAHNATPVDLSLERAGTNPLRELGSFLRVARVIRKIRPDVVLLYTIKPVIYGGLACRLLGVSRYYGMITGIGAAFEPSRSGRRTLLRRMVERLYRMALGGMRRVIFQNEDNRRLFVNNRLVEESRTVIVPGSGVDPDEYRFQERSVPRDGARFLFLGRYLEDKGFISYLRAARVVKNRHPAAEFLVAGKLDGRSGKDERRFLDEALRDEIVQDLGFVEDVAACLSSVDVLVLPSHGEGVPRSVLEAMAVGRPIITSDAPGCRDTVVDDVNGRLVPTGEDAALADAMQDLIERRSVLPRMGRASRERILETFSIGKINRMMLEVMDFPSRNLTGEASDHARPARGGTPEHVAETEHRQHQALDHSGEFSGKIRTRDEQPDRNPENERETEQNPAPAVSAVEREAARNDTVKRYVQGARDRRGQ